MPEQEPLAPAVSETWEGFANIEARYEQTELLDGNGGQSTFELIDHGGYWEFDSIGNRLRVTLRGTSEHELTAKALRWLADRLDAAR